MTEPTAATPLSPLANMDEWEEFLQERYPEDGETGVPTPAGEKAKEAFRDYEADARPTVREFYRLNHAHQTYDFVLTKKKQYLSRNKRRMGIWEAMEYLNNLVDDSDPDTDLTQMEHLLQTSEAIRRDGHPRFLVLTGLVHDLGKILCLWGEPQWAVVGDTFPVGCAFSEKVVFPRFFEANPDVSVPKYQTENGVYAPGCGLGNIHLSWSHDEYMYNVAKDHLPEEALYPIRYHSFYACHREGAYTQFMNDHDREMFHWVHVFNPYDLYSKSAERPNVAELRPYYEDLITEYFPPALAW